MITDNVIFSLGHNHMSLRNPDVRGSLVKFVFGHLNFSSSYSLVRSQLLNSFLSEIELVLGQRLAERSPVPLVLGGGNGDQTL